jgi:hypothetical protein
MALPKYQQSVLDTSTWGTMLTASPAGVSSGPSFGSAFVGSFAEATVAAAPIVSLLGAASSAIGTYYTAQSQQNQLKVQAQNQRFAAEMGRINQRQAEFEATMVGELGARQYGAYSLRAAQQRAGAVASLAGRGAVLGAGSAREALASMDYVAELDRLNINASTVRAREAARLQAFNLGTQAMMSGLSAQNLQATAGTIYPGMALGTSLLGSATDIASTWARNRRIEELLEGVAMQRI